jgi:hypothetical protein
MTKIEWARRQGSSLDTFIPPQARKIEQKFTSQFVKTFTDL